MKLCVRTKSGHPELCDEFYCFLSKDNAVKNYSKNLKSSI